MTEAQYARLEQLNGMEFMTPDEEAEHRRLLAMQSDMEAAFRVLQDAGMNPTWVGGHHIIANVPGLHLLPGGVTIPDSTPEVVRTLDQAIRLVHKCG